MAIDSNRKYLFCHTLMVDKWINVYLLIIDEPLKLLRFYVPLHLVVLSQKIGNII